MSPAAPDAPPELRLVLGAAAAGAGLALAPAGDPDALDDATWQIGRASCRERV